METTLSELKKKIEVLLNSRNQVLSGGGAKDYAQYRQIVGEITGLNLAINEINGLQRKFERNEDGDYE